jgi:hypothetical protein
VGMEDTLSYAPGEPVRDNAQLVARAAEVARIALRPAMPATEARALLGVRDRRPRRTVTSQSLAATTAGASAGSVPGSVTGRPPETAD